MKQYSPHHALHRLIIFLITLALLIAPGILLLWYFFPPSTTASSQSNLIIRAINPGYTVDGTRDVGEFIELQCLADTPFLLTGYSLRYTNTSGVNVELFTFPEQSLMTGETLLLRLARTAEDGSADATYTTTLALAAGPLELLYQGEVVDQICWTGQDECADAFKSSHPTTLARSTPSSDFAHLVDYLPAFDPARPSLELPPPPSEAATTQDTSCAGLFFTEIYSYYSENPSEQFLELYNPTEQDISLLGCYLIYKNKTYDLPPNTLAPQGYYAFYPSTIGLTFTKNPTTSNSIDLVNTDGSVIDTITYPHGQKKSTAYALIYNADGSATWRQTYAITPAAENTYQKYRTCPAGKIINPATGNCINDNSSDALSDCPPGKYRNPLTNRCKTIETEATLKPCAEGYERNPETNRCRKITSENDGASFALSPTPAANHTAFIAIGIIVFLVLIGIGYVVFQFRLELTRAVRKARQRLHHICKHLLSRRIRFRRHK